jgi:hypothetical protein
MKKNEIKNMRMKVCIYVGYIKTILSMCKHKWEKEPKKEKWGGQGIRYRARHTS